MNSADAGMLDQVWEEHGGQSKGSERGWGRRRADFSLCQWKGWKEREREQRQRRKCGIKSRLRAVLKHTDLSSVFGVKKLVFLWLNSRPLFRRGGRKKTTVLL